MAVSDRLNAVAECLTCLNLTVGRNVAHVPSLLRFLFMWVWNGSTAVPPSESRALVFPLLGFLIFRENSSHVAALPVRRAFFL